jgi:flagella basal body P-ring formation protein FlgA
MTDDMTKCLLILVAGAGIASSGIANTGCIPVTGNRILGRDLAFADPSFSALPASLTIGFAPTPGTRRIYTTLELQRLARANGIGVASPEEVCFDIPMVHLAEEDANTAMRRSLPAGAALKIVELANVDVPKGLLEFPIEGLEPPIASNRGVQLWRGHVKYAETRQASVWARVEVTVTFTAVVAGRDLPADTPIKPGSLRIETRTGRVEREKSAARIEEVQGRIPRRAVPAGSVIPIAILADAPDVRRGDPIAVDVWSGSAHLRFEAVAENAARDGDIVELRNPASGKTFRVRLDPGAKALVVLVDGQRL